MPNNFTPVPAVLPATITEMVDGEPRTAASVTQITRPVINATANMELGNIPIAIASFAALKTIDTTALPNGSSRYVTGKGRYFLNTASAAAEIEPWVADPTTGPGRWLHEASGQHARLDSLVYSAFGTFTFTTPNDPSGFVDYFVAGCGQGGGGGGGASGHNIVDRRSGGGGGGGSAVWCATRVRLAAATVHEVVIDDLGTGSGGPGGSNGTGGSGTNGTDGADTILRVQGGAEVMRFKGGGKGYGGVVAVASTEIPFASGGLPVVSAPIVDRVAVSGSLAPFNIFGVGLLAPPSCPGQGGLGSMTGMPGVGSPFAAGAAAGAEGVTDSAGYIHGGSGGGGGGGYYGSVAGVGGDGGEVIGPYPGQTFGGAGQPATGNGAGGGGGGGGAAFSVTGGNGGPGGNGSSGMFIAVRVKSLADPT